MDQPIVYLDGQADGPATDDDIRQVLPPDLYDLYQADQLNDE